MSLSRRDKDRQDSESLTKAWLCGDRVNWAPARRAAAYKWSIETQPLGIERSLGFKCVVWLAGVASAVPGFYYGSGAIAVVAAGFGVAAVYLSVIATQLAANKEYPRALARVGFAWEEAVQEHEGKLNEEFLAQMPGHVGVLALSIAKSMRAFPPEVPLTQTSVFGDLCLRAVAQYARVFSVGWARVERSELLDDERLTQTLLPKVIAEAEANMLKKTIVLDEKRLSSLPKVGPKRI